jgi:PAS domain S-box-containing protein
MIRPAVAWRLSVLGFALSCIVLAVVGWTSARRLADLREATERVNHTQEVRIGLESVLALLRDAEAGQRGFLITGAPPYLDPYKTALVALPPRVERLRTLTADNPRHQASLTTLDTLIREKLAELDTTIVARQARGFDAAAGMVQTHLGKNIMDRIRAIVGEMRAEEGRLLAERSAREERAARAAVVTTIGGLVLALVLVGSATALLSQAVRARGRADAARIAAEAVARAVAESEERLRITLASIGDAVIATDAEGRVTLMNAVAEALTGWSAADAAGRALADVFVIVNEDSRRPVPNPVYEVVRLGTTTGLANHTILIAKDGREIPIDDSAAPIRDAAGRLLGVVMVFRNIAERRYAERERAALLRKEREARAEAEAANYAKDQFLAVLSHELRTPLNTILGWLQMLRGGRLEAAQHERALDAIERGTREQARMIDDLLDLSRIAAGKMQLDARPLDLAPLIDEAVESLLPQARAKGLALEARVGPAGGPVSADADRMRQVLRNLLVNALKFTPAGGRVDVEVATADDGLRIVVRDTGVGIEPDLLPHVFERFRQADWRTAGTRGGLGLGLAIVREIVDMHGGAVEARSEGPGRGAEFVVTLPLVRSPR